MTGTNAMELHTLPKELGEDGIWADVLVRPQADMPRAALFLDRDGVVVDEVNYLHRAEDVRLIEGATRVIAAANRRSVPVVLITNQAGIGRRYYDWPAFTAVQEKIDIELERADVYLDAVYACPFHPEGREPYRHPDHPARKPNPGMLTRAAADLNLDLSASWMIGDRAIDIRAARNAGCAGAMHVRTGHGVRRHEREAAHALASGDFQVVVGESVGEALSAIPLLTG